MSTDKHKSFERFYSLMGSSNANLSYDPREKDKVDYAGMLGAARTGNPHFDAFVDRLSAEMRLIDSVDPYAAQPMKTIDEKVNVFLMSHAGIDFEAFMRQSRPEKFRTNDFANLLKGNLRKRLFRYRAKLYISALADCERSGYRVEDVIYAAQDRKIPFLKKEKDEPTFQRVMKVLGVTA